MTSQGRINLPPELDNDQTAAVFYSPFREQSLNPQSYSRKMKLWENLLTDAALERKIVTFDVNSLSVMFERKGIKPKCLGTVVEEMKKTGKVRSAVHYRKANGWLYWGFATLVKQPLVWGASQLFGPSKTPPTEVLVWPEVVKKLCGDVAELHYASIQNELTDVLVSMASLRFLCRFLIPNDQDFEIVLTQMERDRKIAFIESPDKEILIKLCKMGELTVSPIRESEIHIYRIQATMKKLEEELEILSARVQSQVNDARLYLRADRKTMAMHCLRKKKTILKMMDKKSASLATLHNIVQSIEEASTNEMVMKACAVGVAAVKKLNKDVNVESVESVMDTVKEALEDNEEINQALMASMPKDDDHDSQLERELELLLNDTSKSTIEESGDDKRQEELDRILRELPNVPQHPTSQAEYREKSQAGTSKQQPLPS